MTFKSSEKAVKEKLRDFEREDLEEYCKNSNIKGLQREQFVANSIQSIVSTENGDTE